MEVKPAEHCLGLGIPLLRSLPVPGDRLIRVLRRPAAGEAHDAHGPLCVGIALSSGFPEPFHRLSVILPCASPAKIPDAGEELRLRIPLFRCLKVKPQCLFLILHDGSP